MAQWSTKDQDDKKAKRIASIITERADIFKRFRAAGWAANVVNPADDRNFVIMPDNWVGNGFTYHFRIKMPGAYPVRVKNMAQLLRLVKGAV